MKKIISFLFFVTMLINTPVFAANIEIQPTMYSRSNEQNRIWVGSFQLVWNDFINKIVHNPVRFREGTPILIQELNKQTFKTDSLSDKCYYGYAGKLRKNTKRLITKNIRKKFRETSDLLNKLDLNPRNDQVLVYAMLKKDFEFYNSFDKLGHSNFKLNSIAEYFGIDANSDKRLREGVEVLFYNSFNDFAIKLATTGVDEVILYKNSSNKPFNYIYDDLNKKQKAYKGQNLLNKQDELKIPNIRLFEEKLYEELTNRRIMGTNIVISQALQTISFDMNHQGVKLKSEAGLTAEVTSLLPPEENSPRLLYFDDTFVIFLKEKEKHNPYFALRVNDIELFQEK